MRTVHFMSILHRYVTKEILKYIAIVMITVVAVYLAVDFFEKIDDFFEAGLPVRRAAVFFLFKTPFIIAQILPVAVLLAVLIVFGLMNKNNEITALKSCGVSIYHLLKPTLLIGLFSGAALFLFSETLVPKAVEKANRIWYNEVKGHAATLSEEKNIWLKGNRRITHIKFYNRARKEIFGYTAYEFDKSFDLVRRVDARQGIYQDDGWVFFDMMEQRLNRKDNAYDVTFHDKRREPLDLLPDELQNVAQKSEEMSFKELYDYVKKIEAEGYDATVYRVDLYAKIAYPLICLILSMLGAGIAARGRTRDGMTAGIAYGIGIAFLYWIFYSLCLSLGYGEMLPPVVAVWTANFIFGCLGVFTLLNVE